MNVYNVQCYTSIIAVVQIVADCVCNIWLGKFHAPLQVRHNINNGKTIWKESYTLSINLLNRHFLAKISKLVRDANTCSILSKDDNSVSDFVLKRVDHSNWQRSFQYCISTFISPTTLSMWIHTLLIVSDIPTS